MDPNASAVSYANQTESKPGVSFPEWSFYPVLWVREASLYSLVELLEGLAEEQWAVGGRLQDGSHQLRQVRLEQTGALLDYVSFCLQTMQSRAPTSTNDNTAMSFTFKS